MMVAVPLLLSKEYLKRNAKMEKSSTNHPRFCAKYVKPIGVAKETKVGWTRVFEMNGKFYIISRHNDYKIGQKVWIAKKNPTPGQTWNVHEITIPEHYWNYEYHHELTAKEQRTTPYEPRPRYWFGTQCYIIEETTEEYIQRKFAFNKKTIRKMIK